MVTGFDISTVKIYNQLVKGSLVDGNKLNNILILKKSYVTVRVNNINLSGGAKLARIEVSCGDRLIVKSDNLTNNNDITIKLDNKDIRVKVVDSSGDSMVKTKTTTPVIYTPPKISGAKMFRASGANHDVVDLDSRSLACTFNYSMSSLRYSSEELNKLKVTVEWYDSTGFLRRNDYTKSVVDGIHKDAYIPPNMSVAGYENYSTIITITDAFVTLKFNTYCGPAGFAIHIKDNQVGIGTKASGQQHVQLKVGSTIQCRSLEGDWLKGKNIQSATGYVRTFGVDRLNIENEHGSFYMTHGQGHPYFFANNNKNFYFESDMYSRGHKVITESSLKEQFTRGNGYVKLPTGEILQYGTFNKTIAGGQACTLPVAYNSYNYVVTATPYSPSFDIKITTRNWGQAFTVYAFNKDGTEVPCTIKWLAIGKVG